MRKNMAREYKRTYDSMSKKLADVRKSLNVTDSMSQELILECNKLGERIHKLREMIDSTQVPALVTATQNQMKEAVEQFQKISKNIEELRGDIETSLKGLGPKLKEIKDKDKAIATLEKKFEGMINAFTSGFVRLLGIILEKYEKASPSSAETTSEKTKLISSINQLKKDRRDMVNDFYKDAETISQKQKEITQQFDQQIQIIKGIAAKGKDGQFDQKGESRQPFEIEAAKNNINSLMEAAKNVFKRPRGKSNSPPGV